MHQGQQNQRKAWTVGLAPYGYLQLQSVVSTQHNLYHRYSSSQHYFYSNLTTEIVKEKCVPNNIIFEDLGCYLDEDEYLKRGYCAEEYPCKLATFKEYYFYHEDCPRVFGHSAIAQLYEKWHERKRDYIYKRLKIMYNETYSSLESSDKSTNDMAANPHNVTHFLLQISDYNPFSKKYYLRVQARQEKERELELEKRKGVNQNPNESGEMYANLNKQLSHMLKKVGDELSILTVVEEEAAANYILDFNRNTKLGIKWGESSKEKSRNTTIKHNFRKKEPIQAQMFRDSDTLKTMRKIEIASPAKGSVKNDIYMETEGSDNILRSEQRQPYKKQIHQLSPSRREFPLGYNLQIDDSKKKSILLMSSLGYKNYIGSEQAIIEDRLSRKLEDKKERKKSDMAPINNYQILKSYKSLQRYDHYNPPTERVRQKVISINEPKNSSSKLARISPAKQRPLKESLVNAVDKKLGSRFSEFKKQEPDRKNMEEFNDRKMVKVADPNKPREGFRGLISYKSERIDPQLSSNLNLNIRQLKRQGQASLKVLGRKQREKEAARRDEVERIEDGTVEKKNQSQKKRSIRISFKSNDNFKNFNK